MLKTTEVAGPVGDARELCLPVVNSEYLFRALAALFRADLICDVGAFDGAHSKRFARSGTRVVAIEANPHNFAALSSDPEIGDLGIDARHCAMTNFDGETEFNLVKMPSEDASQWVSMIGSIRTRRPDIPFDFETVVVAAQRLDTFVPELRPTPSCIALWIDVEGSGHEVLEGMVGIGKTVCAAHVEVEMRRFWEEQHLWPDTEALMRKVGFSPLARRPGDLQVDVVFVNDAFSDRHRLRVRWLVFFAWLRLRAGRLRGALRRALVRSRLSS